MPALLSTVVLSSGRSSLLVVVTHAPALRARACCTCEPQPRAAVERPDIREMFDAVTQGLSLVASIENKAYSRDWLTPGRLRVQLKRADGTLVNPRVGSKSALLQQCAALCARHAERPRRLEELAKYEAQLFSGGAPVPGGKGAANKGGAAAAAAKAPAAKAAPAKGGSKKSKGRRK